MDQSPSESQDQDGIALAPGGQGWIPGGQGDEMVSEHFRWSTRAVPGIDTPFPEPYYALSETFGY